MARLSPRVLLHLLSIVCFAPCLLPYTKIADNRTRYSILISALISVLGFFATKRLVPLIKTRTLKAGLYGHDINKKGSKEGEKRIPESLGLAPGLIFLVSLCVTFTECTQRRSPDPLLCSNLSPFYITFTKYTPSHFQHLTHLSIFSTGLYSLIPAAPLP